MSLKKIDRPPYVHNWVRYNDPDEAKTTKGIVNFIRSAPPITYIAGSPIIRDRILLGLDRATALQAAKTRGRANSRELVFEFVSAFYDYDLLRNYSGLPSYDQFVEPYRAGREVKIPVKPLAVISEGGLLKPVFVVGWASMPLNLFQRRLLMTVIEDSVFSLTDFQNSTGEFVSFPREDKSDPASRKPEVWHRGDFDLLSHKEMKEQMDVYLRALDAAKKIVADDKPETPKPSKEAPVDIRQGNLDLGPK